LRWRCFCPPEEEEEEEEAASHCTINEGFNSKVEIHRAVNIVFPTICSSQKSHHKACGKHDLETDVCHE